MPDIKQVKTPLDQLTAGEGGVIEAYQGQRDLHQRLKELGLVRGTFVMVKRFAPLGDPMEIVVRGYHLSIRKQDAATILVRLQPSDNRQLPGSPHPIPLPFAEGRIRPTLFGGGEEEK